MFLWIKICNRLYDISGPGYRGCGGNSVASEMMQESVWSDYLMAEQGGSPNLLDAMGKIPRASRANSQ
jgi:hypothetical protein